MDTTTVLIIGSGFGGQVTAINLLRRGITDFRILERRDFMGGTWCQNSYPGAAVDVPSPLYSIASEPYPWTRMYAEQAELRDYTEHVIDRHRLRERTVLGAEVVSADWDGEGWSVTTSDGDVHRGRFLVNASGPLSTPVVPPFAGLDDFAGHAFHTNGWDHDVDLTGKRVAVIGSGASAAQVIPAIQPAVGGAPRLPAQPPLGAPPPRPGLHPAPAARVTAAAAAARPCAPRSTGSSRRGSSASSTAAGC